MALCCCPTIYNPLNEPTHFKVFFDENETLGYAKQEQRDRAQRAIAHLDTLDAAKIVRESVEFYKWIVMYPTSECNIHYAEALLDYFHSKRMLTCKQSINTTMKQMKPRYLVMFTFKNLIFTKSYNSIREIKADTGRKPSQIKRQHISHLHAVKVNNT